MINLKEEAVRFVQSQASIIQQIPNEDWYISGFSQEGWIVATEIVNRAFKSLTMFDRSIISVKILSNDNQAIFNYLFTLFSLEVYQLCNRKGRV